MPSIKIKKSDIVEMSIKIIRKDGIDKLNARYLSKLLKCSTQPIFSNYKTMEDLKCELILEVKKIQTQYLQEGIKNNVKSFKGLGLGYIEFAKQEKNLYKFLLSRQRNKKTFDDDSLNLDLLVEMMSKNLLISKDEAFKMQIEMWIVVHGISSMIVNSFMDFSDELIDQILTDIFIGLKYVHKGENSEGNN